LGKTHHSYETPIGEISSHNTVEIHPVLKPGQACMAHQERLLRYHFLTECRISPPWGADWAVSLWTEGGHGWKSRIDSGVLEEKRKRGGVRVLG